MEKQYEMLKNILYFHEQSLSAIEAEVETAEIFKLAVREEIARAKYIPQDDITKVAKIRDTIDEQMKEIQSVKVET
jgi:V/A-type H+-transporting ATPase subunit A